MFVHYTRQLLAAEDGLTDSERVNLAAAVEKWAKEYITNDIVKVHRVLDKLIDRTLNQKDRLSLSLNNTNHEDTEFIDLIRDPKAKEPPEIMIADESLREIDNEEAQEFVDANLEGEDHEVISQVLETNPDGHYDLDVDGNTVQERLSIVKPRIRKGKLLVPKKTVGIYFFDGKLKIKYLRGYDDEKVNEALYWYSRGFGPGQIAKRMDVAESTLYRWLYKNMGLPRLGQDHNERKEKREEILRLYNDGLRPLEIGKIVGCSHDMVYRTLKRLEGLDFGWGGPDPWVYELQGAITDTGDLPGFKLEKRNAWLYEKRDEKVFNYIIRFEENNGRGPSRDEIYDALGFQPWTYLHHFVDHGILSKRKLPKEEMHTNRAEIYI